MSGFRRDKAFCERLPQIEARYTAHRWLTPPSRRSPFRRLGATAYGYQLFSDRISFDQMVAMFHGDNERVDLETLRLSTELWLYVTRDLLS